MASIRARELRANMTDAERMLWRALRRHQLGARFRRQVPLGPYVADFVCFDRKLVIEVDGGQHAERQALDEVRSEFLSASGYRVLRFWNNEVLGNIEGVLDEIDRALAVRITPHPNPPPQGGRE
jgi:very-short-patch-repair endonuclease